jgi:ubiquinone/menaquinone biosynthesis C-methylase UbiE/uncharacterized protein YbaR (Trm112 family)
MTPPDTLSPAELLRVLVCPRCHGILATRAEEQVVCEGCSATYPVEGGLLDLYVTGEREGEQATRITRANQEYHDAVAAEYEEDAETSLIFGAACQARLRTLLGQLARETGGELLVDVGCGTGNVLLPAREHFRASVGCDVAPGMLAQARERGLAVLRGNAYRLPLADGAASVVTCFSVLHHLEDLPGFLAEVHRVLRPGGALYSDWDPNSRLSHGLVRLARHPLLYRPARSLWRLVAGESRREACYRQRQLDEVFQLAEYHAFQVSCDPERIRRETRSAGFDTAALHYHANATTLEEDGWGDLSRGKRAALRLRGLLAGELRRERLLPLFLMIARKGRGAGP